MPELPEVETIVRQLNKTVIGRKVVDVWNDWPRALRTHTLPMFRKVIKNLKIIKAHRRAKYIFIDLTENKTLVIHQKLSGHLMYGKWRRKGKTWSATTMGPLRDDPYNGHVRFVMTLDNGNMIALSDLRRFGRIYLGNTDNIENMHDLAKLGPEPLEIAKSKKRFTELFRNKRGVIKSVLMDPYFIAGIGNIYSDEILWYAGIVPTRRVESLTVQEVEALRKYTPRILKKAIKATGDSNQDFRTLFGEFGRYQKQHKAYQLTGQPCSRKDRGMIVRQKIGGRSTHFCPVHQN